jgi:hypothetical protein
MEEDSPMTVYRRMLGPVIALCATLALASPARAQAVTTADLQRLQDAVFDAGRDVAALRSTDAALATRLENDLDTARDDVAYLRGKLRREGSVSRGEYVEVQQRIDDIRAQARGTAPARSTTMSDDPGPVRRPTNCGPMDVCVGQEIDVRVQVPLNSDTANVEDRFEATTLVSFYNENNELIPAGSLMRGVVSGVDRAGRVDRKGRLSLSFDELLVRGRSFRIRATVTQAIESAGIKGEAVKLGTGAGVGAIIGGILGGVKGAIAGVLIGGGGMVAATEGKDVKIPAGTVLRVRFDAPVTID